MGQVPTTCLLDFMALCEWTRMPMQLKTPEGLEVWKNKGAAANLELARLNQ